jgi:tripartite-type tricarboxylate transporter receptor subunit TctC
MRFLTKPLTTLLVAASAAAAHAWPEQPITLVVPYTPGTGIDLVARQLSARLPALLGQPVIVENLAGASGNIGSEKVARAKPDGYTLMVQVNTLVMNRSLYKSLSYDPVADFTPVSLTSWGTLLLVTNPNVQKATSVAQMVSAAKAEPGKLTYATPGVGTPHHLSMALLMQGTGTELMHVPYKGTAGAVTDLWAVASTTCSCRCTWRCSTSRSASSKPLPPAAASACRNCPTCRRSPKRASPPTTWTCGTACSRPRARRPTWWRASTRRSRRF